MTRGRFTIGNRNETPAQHWPQRLRTSRSCHGSPLSTGARRPLDLHLGRRLELRGPAGGGRSRSSTAGLQVGGRPGARAGRPGLRAGLHRGADRRRAGAGARGGELCFRSADRKRTRPHRPGRRQSSAARRRAGAAQRDRGRHRRGRGRFRAPRRGRCGPRRRHPPAARRSARAPRRLPGDRSSRTRRGDDRNRCGRSQPHGHRRRARRRWTARTTRPVCGRIAPCRRPSGAGRSSMRRAGSRA